MATALVAITAGTCRLGHPLDDVEEFALLACTRRARLTAVDADLADILDLALDHLQRLAETREAIAADAGRSADGVDLRLRQRLRGRRRGRALARRGLRGGGLRGLALAGRSVGRSGVRRGFGGGLRVGGGGFGFGGRSSDRRGFLGWRSVLERPTRLVGLPDDTS